MVKIGSINTGAQITRQTPVPRISQETFTGPAKNLQAISGTLAEVAQKFEDAKTLHETTVADTKARNMLAELKLEAQTTSDVFDVKSFQDRIAKIRNEASKGISLPRAKSDFALNFDRTAIAADFDIRKILSRRQIDTMKATMLENIDALRGSVNRDAELDLLLESGKQKLLITNVEAFKLKKTTLKDWQEKDIRSAIAVNPDSVEARILAGEFGELTADETAKWLEVAEKKKKRNAKEAQIALDTKQLTNAINVASKLAEVSVTDIIEMASDGSISPKIADDWIKWKTDPLLAGDQYESDKDIWKDLTDESLKTDIDLREFISKVTEAQGNGKIKGTDAVNFTDRIGELMANSIDFRAKQNKRSQQRKISWEMFKGGLFGVVGASVTMMRLLNEKDKSGIPDDEIVPAANDILRKQILGIQPNILAFKEGGQIMMDAEGNKALVFPDGTIQEIE